MKERDKLVRCVEEALPEVRERMPFFTVDASDVDEELMEVFIAQMRLDIEALSEAVCREDWITGANHAHSIKGMGGSAGMPELSVLAEAMEKAGKAGDGERMRELQRTLTAYFTLVQASA